MTAVPALTGTLPSGAARRSAARITPTADIPNKPAITRPMAMSGQAEPVIATPRAARSTPAFAMTSLREQSHTERMLMSPARWRQRKGEHRRIRH